MNSVPLTPREWRVLAVIESELSRDRDLDRRLRTMRCPLSSPMATARPALWCGLLASLGLLVAATVTASEALALAFAVVWPTTLVLAAVVLRGWCLLHPGVQ